jgi:hypothetical protein
LAPTRARTFAAGLTALALSSAALLLPSLARAAVAAEIGPGADLCARINALAPGEELVLRPGDYRGPCTIVRGGTAEAPVLIRAADPEHPPRIVYGGASSNVFSVKAGHITIRGLRFGPTRWNVDAVRVYSGNGVTVEECEFSGVGGIAVVANHNSLRELTVRRNTVSTSGATAMYFGCHDGTWCTVSRLLVEQNDIRHVRARDSEIGYGIQVKLNSSGVIRDNVIVDTKGPGIMVYGAHQLETTTLVERNLVMGSLSSSGIVVGGGPAVVRNNVAILNREAGIALQDYRGRGFLRGVTVTHNTVYDNREGGILVSGRGLRDAAVLNNAAHARPGFPALPRPHPALRLSGNVDCSQTPCFVNPDGRDFSPLVGSLLMGLGTMGTETGAPADDFFGARRSIPPTVGAIERPAGPIPLGPKPPP